MSQLENSPLHIDLIDLKRAGVAVGVSLLLAACGTTKAAPNTNHKTRQSHRVSNEGPSNLTGHTTTTAQSHASSKSKNGTLTRPNVKLTYNNIDTDYPITKYSTIQFSEDNLGERVIDILKYTHPKLSKYISETVLYGEPTKSGTISEQGEGSTDYSPKKSGKHISICSFDIEASKSTQTGAYNDVSVEVNNYVQGEGMQFDMYQGRVPFSNEYHNDPWQVEQGEGPLGVKSPGIGQTVDGDWSQTNDPRDLSVLNRELESVTEVLTELSNDGCASVKEFKY
jgi:hypothetical protein